MVKEKTNNKEEIETKCASNNHNYQMVQERGYYKNLNGKQETAIVYNMLYCTKCGETKEIIVCRR